MRGTLLIGLVVMFCLCVVCAGCQQEGPVADTAAELTKVVDVAE